MRPDAGQVCQSLIVVSYCTPGSAECHAASATRSHRSRAPTVLVTWPVVRAVSDDGMQTPPTAATGENLILIAEVETAVSGAVASLKMVSEAIPGFPRFGPLKKLNGGDPAYIGLAVTLKGDTATVTAFVPASAITAGRDVLESLFKKIE